MKFSPIQQEKIRDLSRDPVFGSILEDIQNVAPTPRYRVKGDEDAKINNWINKSGFVDGVEYVVKLLRYEHE